MKSQFTLAELAAQIMDRSNKKQDFVADSRTLTYLPAANQINIAGKHEFVVNDHAHSQIAAHTEIPAGYYKRMREEAPELLKNNIETWFQKHPAQRMLRTIDGTARAFLSDKYSRMDDDAFAGVVLPAISEVPGAEVVSCGLTDLKTTIKFKSARFERQIKKVGDVVQFGIAFSNSEVGAGRLTGSLFAYQLICTNGMVIEEEAFASTHVGKRHTTRDLGEVFQLDTIKADGQATILKLRDFSREILTDRFIDQQVERMRGLAEVKVTDPVKSVEALAKQHGFSDGTRNDVLKHLIEGGDLSMWGLQNAVTRAAADQADYDDATRLETLGGRFLTLPKTEYRQLATAA